MAQLVVGGPSGTNLVCGPTKLAMQYNIIFYANTAVLKIVTNRQCNAADRYERTVSIGVLGKRGLSIYLVSPPPKKKRKEEKKSHPGDRSIKKHTPKRPIFEVGPVACGLAESVGGGGGRPRSTSPPSSLSFAVGPSARAKQP